VNGKAAVLVGVEVVAEVLPILGQHAEQGASAISGDPSPEEGLLVGFID
jgi:hypothetical protein